MMKRRQLLKITSVLTLAAALPSFGSATPDARALAQNSGGGYMNFKVGDIEMLIVTDGHILIESAQPIIAPGIGGKLVAAALNSQFLSSDEIDAAINVLVISGKVRQSLLIPAADQGWVPIRAACSRI